MIALYVCELPTNLLCIKTIVYKLHTIRYTQSSHFNVTNDWLSTPKWTICMNHNIALTWRCQLGIVLYVDTLWVCNQAYNVMLHILHRFEGYITILVLLNWIVIKGSPWVAQTLRLSHFWGWRLKDWPIFRLKTEDWKDFEQLVTDWKHMLIFWLKTESKLLS